MQLGDLDALKTILFNDTQYGFWHDSVDGSDVAYTQRDLFKCIDLVPTIDAVPVVRCAKCVHYEMGVCLKIYSDGAVSKYAWQERKPDDFCSYGEKRCDDAT